MTDPQKLLALADAICALKGPCRETDVKVCVALQWSGNPADDVQDLKRADHWSVESPFLRGANKTNGRKIDYWTPDLTTSLDANAALQEARLKGWRLFVAQAGDNEWRCSLAHPDHAAVISVAQTRACAELAATLRALAAGK